MRGKTLGFIVGVMVASSLAFADGGFVLSFGATLAILLGVPPAIERLRGALHGRPVTLVRIISVAAGLFKAILVMIATPIAARHIGLDNPQSAMVYGGLMGTNSGVAAGLAATDPKLVPYGVMTATFYTGLGCLLCPSVLFLAVKALASALG